jgi:serine/threonine protein kinase
MPKHSHRPDLHKSHPDLLGETWNRLEQILAGFEDAWQRGERPNLDDYLHEGAEYRNLLLLELVHGDLEYRLRAGEAARVEDYLRRYPELAREPGAVVGLVAAEYALRLRADGCSVEEFLERFPAYREELADRLADEEGSPQTPPGQRGGLTAAGGKRDTVAEGEAGKETEPVPHGGSGFPSLPGYEILGELGRGGMGVVYRARHLKLNRLVAVKMIRAGTETEAAELARFRREAEAVARLQHPNVVQIFEVDEQDERPYFTMELVDGGSLADLLAGKPCPPQQAARLVEVLARAVHHAHQHGIVHRDLKPANILLQKSEVRGQKPEEDGRPLLPDFCPLTSDLCPKVTDFGLAKCLESDASLTQTGAIVGTPAYMAPEQAAGRSQAIGPAVDVYALGAILYEALTGQPPFRGTTMLEILEQVKTCEPVPPRRLQPGVPRDLETICLKALAKEPARRYASALALAQDLELFSAGEPIRARPERLPAWLWRKARRRPLVLVSVLLLAVAGAVAGAVGLAASRDREVTLLVHEIETGLQTPELTQDYLRRMEARIAELNELLPEKAVSARLRLYRRFADRIREEFADRLSPEQAAPLQTAIAWLHSRDANLAETLARECNQRLGGWEPVFRLEAPFANRDQVFLDAAKRMRLGPEGKVLLRRNAAKDYYVIVQPAWAGNVRLSALYDNSWAKAAQLGLGWWAGDHYYWFLLSVPESFARLGEPEPLEPLRTFADSRQEGKTVMLSIIRKNARLVQTPVAASELFADCPPDGGLRLEVRRENDRLIFQINQRTTVTFSEIFPISLAESVRFGMYWPEGVGLHSLHGDRLLGPAVPSALEKGDALFNHQHHEDAQKWYQQAARNAREDRVRQEARYKEGLCLLALKHTDDAARVFEKLAAEGYTGGETRGGKDWPAMADCQLLLVYHRQSTPEGRAAVDGILDKLIARQGHRPGEFATIIPIEDREGLFSARSLHAARVVLRKPEEIVSDCERANKAATLFESHEGSRLAVRMELVRAYHLAGRDAEAIGASNKLQSEFQKYCQDNGLWGTWVLQQHCWLLRRHYADKDGALLARRELDQWLFPSPNVPRRDDRGPVYFPLVERARLNAALGLWGEAEKDLESFFRFQEQDTRRGYDFHAAACLLQGFLREKRGDTKGALAAWQRGLVKSWARQYPKDPAGQLLVGDLTDEPRIALVLHMIMAALVDDFSDAEAEQVLNRLLFRNRAGQAPGEANAAVGLVINTLKPPPGVLREVWRAPRGREWARRFAYRDLSYAEYFRTPFVLVAAEVLHQRALPGPLRDEQERLLWTLCQDLDSAFKNGILKERHLFSLGAAWKGVNFAGMGWKDVDKAVLQAQPHLRGPLAYVLGHKSLQHRHKRRADAVTYFKIAFETGKGNTELRRLAQTELDRITRWVTGWMVLCGGW